MIRLDLELQLEYEILDDAGADFIFNIHAARTGQQFVRHEQLSLSQPLQPQFHTDATATRFMRVHAQPGPLTLSYAATVDIDHHRCDPASLREVPVRELPLDLMPYLYPSRYCQADRLLRLAAREFGGMPPGYSRVVAIQQWVQQRTTFASNTSTASTSALDTLLDQVGVCRDFTHLMIALCRAVNIPCRMATGTDYGADVALGPPDFHAYVEAFLGDRWYIFDASGTGIPLGFMRFGTGRDAADVAFATIFGRVNSLSPLIRVEARSGPGLELPHPVDAAISTSALHDAGVPAGGDVEAARSSAELSAEAY
ncbi:transglutaminase-like domain-containing protein [Ramlibacter rhizophilus]|uniref:Transglutaminase family protein n=1 Tax=Ramlibacter rhizophilus TaxID=1781167 RepID=A0A4Z0C057_9BURK|nr:transglutaminase family protein [Ramlibacter rhizophilus]TFZ04916.1 transglutaminase family protein [Ramlibacter rhizophilus]